MATPSRQWRRRRRRRSQDGNPCESLLYFYTRIKNERTLVCLCRYFPLIFFFLRLFFLVAFASFLPAPFSSISTWSSRWTPLPKSCLVPCCPAPDPVVYHSCAIGDHSRTVWSQIMFVDLLRVSSISHSMMMTVMIIGGISVKCTVAPNEAQVKVKDWCLFNM